MCCLPSHAPPVLCPSGLLSRSGSACQLTADGHVLTFNLQSNHMMAALAPRATGSSTVTPQNKRTFKIYSSQHRSRDRRRLQVSLLSTDGKSSTGNVSCSGFYSPLCHFSATSVPRCCASKQKVHFKVSPVAAVRSASTDTGPRLVVLVVNYPKSSGKATLCGRRVLTGSRCQLSEGLFSLVHIQYVWVRFTNIKRYIYRSGFLILIPALIIDCLIASFVYRELKEV